MKKVPGTGALVTHTEKALDAHHTGWLFRKVLLTVLKWEMAVIEDDTVRTFLAGVRKRDNHAQRQYTAVL